jgi:hypothetical protein
MMNKYLLAALLAITTPAKAATFDCIPSLFEWTSVYNSEGTMYSWICQRADTKWYINSFYVLKDYSATQACKDAITDLRTFGITGLGYGQNLVDKANGVFNTCVTPTPVPGSREDIVKNTLLLATRALWNPPPPVYAYTVKPNGLYTWRYTYPVDPATGKRSLTFNGKVDVGTACDPAVRKITELNTNLWMAFGPAFNPNVVTLCALKTP